MKKKEDLRIVYMGTPEFAVESLKCRLNRTKCPRLVGLKVIRVVVIVNSPRPEGLSPMTINVFRVPEAYVAVTPSGTK